MEANKIAAEDAASLRSPSVASSGDLDVERRHEFASQRFTIQELNKFLNRMRGEVPSQDVKVPIMGVYNHCCTGSAIAHWIQQNTKARTIEEAEHIGQSLSDEGFLRLIGQRGNKFLASPANFYQWRDQMFELLDEDDREEEMSLVKKTKQEVEKADAAYLAAVKKADLTRLQLEVGLVSFVYENERTRREHAVVSRLAYDPATFKNGVLQPLHSLTPPVSIFSCSCYLLYCFFYSSLIWTSCSVVNSNALTPSRMVCIPFFSCTLGVSVIEFADLFSDRLPFVVW